MGRAAALEAGSCCTPIQALAAQRQSMHEGRKSDMARAQHGQMGGTSINLCRAWHSVQSAWCSAHLLRQVVVCVHGQARVVAHLGHSRHSMHSIRGTSFPGMQACCRDVLLLKQLLSSMAQQQAAPEHSRREEPGAGCYVRELPRTSSGWYARSARPARGRKGGTASRQQRSSFSVPPGTGPC